ncbi:MAG TPA: ATP-binding protein, partial [Lachnospiraceae bacterium]|nr:ATP-binding protein [Lachnospiraceae bacterium]
TDKEGMLTEYQLRYLLMDTSGDHSDSDRTLAFVDVSEQLSDFHKLVLTLVIVGVLCELAFLIISIFLAKFTIKPVRIAWEQQRQFVADASHELKTPLTVILANVGILLGHKENTIAREEKWVDYIKTEAERMKKLVEDMLFLAKTDMAGLPVERRKINFSDLVMSSLLAFESVAFENGIKLKQEIAQEIALYGNETQLRQMAIIFLDNACKYTPSGGEVMVRLIKKQDKIYFSVKNTGSYIPKEVQDRIFERFYRVDESRVRKEGGYGLGLSIAKSIVDSHKGKLTVSSSEKDGTTFTMQFPQ